MILHQARYKEHYDKSLFSNICSILLIGEAFITSWRTLMSVKVDKDAS